VRVDGKSSVTLSRTEIPRLRRRLGVVFQDFRLLDDRTAEQNVAFALEVTGTPEAAIGPKVARVLTQVGSRPRPPPCRTNSPAASSSAWRSPGRW
jgi:cell division transport system ATP-binding protein